MPTATAHKKWKYDLHPSVRMVQSVIAGMKEKTGHSLEDWMRLTKKNAPADKKQSIAWLKSQHGLGTNYATWIAGRALGGASSDEDAEQ